MKVVCKQVMTVMWVEQLGLHQIVLVHIITSASITPTVQLVLHYPCPFLTHHCVRPDTTILAKLDAVATGLSAANHSIKNVKDKALAKTGMPHSYGPALLQAAPACPASASEPPVAVLQVL